MSGGARRKSKAGGGKSDGEGGGSGADAAGTSSVETWSWSADQIDWVRLAMGDDLLANPSEDEMVSVEGAHAGERRPLACQLINL